MEYLRIRRDTSKDPRKTWYSSRTGGGGGEYLCLRCREVYDDHSHSVNYQDHHACGQLDGCINQNSRLVRYHGHCLRQDGCRAKIRLVFAHSENYLDHRASGQDGCRAKIRLVFAYCVNCSHRHAQSPRYSDNESCLCPVLL